MRKTIVEFMTDRRRDPAVITAIASSARGTKFRYRHVKVVRAGKEVGAYRAAKALAIKGMIENDR